MLRQRTGAERQRNASEANHEARHRPLYQQRATAGLAVERSVRPMQVVNGNVQIVAALRQDRSLGHLSAVSKAIGTVIGFT